MARNTQTENIHQRISFGYLVEVNLAAYRRYADAVPIVRDSGNHASKQAPIVPDLRRPPMDRTETQRVKQKHRTRSHRKDIANNPAYSSCSALERLDCTGVIMALHLEGDSPTVPDVDHTGIFLSGLHQHFRARYRKLLKFKPCIFIGA